MKYKVNFINASYRRQYKKWGKKMLKAVEKCVAKGDFVLRKDVLEFEEKLANFVGTKYAVACSSGTDAIFLSLKALGIGPGDEVITPGHTFIASIQSVVHAGATPILIDVGEDALMDVSKIEALITPRTKAIMPVHLSGKVCDMTTIMDIAKRHNLYVIEDACQSLGAYWGDQMSGSIGHTGTFSFISPKLMGAWGDNGAITLNDEALYHKLRLMRNHWNITQGALHGAQPQAPEVMEWGWNMRMDNIQAAVLNVKFKYLPWILKRRKEIAMRYDKAFRKMKWPVKLPILQDKQVFQEYILRIGMEKLAFVHHMQKRGVELLIRDVTPNHKLKGYNMEHFNLPVTEAMAVECVRLPTYPEMTNKEVDYVIKCVKEFYGA